MAAIPVLPALPMVVPAMVRVPERYEGGRHGVSAEVTIPAGDAALMNELGSMVPALHLMASRLSGFSIHSDHLRKLIRDLRILATDAQEEVEMRRGSP